MMLEGRVGAEVSMLMLQLPLLRMQVKHGQGPVMVLPGFMADGCGRSRRNNRRLLSCPQV